MFYYPDVLHRHTGCFATIWLAATKGIRITRRELLKVNVNRTCGDILDYVRAKVPPPQQNLPKPRFSLYLSSQLQYGVIVVYHRQCGFLLEEIQQIIDRLLRSKKCINIDMVEPDRLALNVPDSLYVMEEAEGAQDPFFGLMASHQLPSPYKTHQPMLATGEAGSQHSLVPRSYTSLDTEGFRSPPAAISLREKEQFVITAAECFEGDDLPEATAREIDLLMDQPDQFRGEVEDRQTDLGAMSSIDLLKETLLGAEQSVWLPGEESAHPVERPLAARDFEMTPLQVAMPSEGDRATEGSYDVVGVPPLRKPGGRRRRQLVFADPQVQISERAMKEQITNPLPEVLLDLPFLTKSAAPAQLFSAPCGSLLHADLQSLWKQCASPIVQQRGEEEEEARGESEQDREILRAERKRRNSSMREVGLSEEEAQLRMDPIAEENIEMPEAQTDTEQRDMLSWISSSLQQFGDVTFDSLVPPEAGRAAAAHTLYKLLELLSARHVTVQQTEPFSNICIRMAA
ncbi:hypothetical protein FQN60_013870 [Etheostoma spectabile]|uniref:Rad21/Rec8-like protein N-terminal domain-containing protein n=1 Tax=Etheostoma spectabile TaxID=54343 RepID=A0A5J5CGB4_9PERO|nr:hypothetical protein FQN60_013870 [Etheostoma spectabile]